MTKFEANIATVPCVVEVESLKPESLAFLLEYGIRQYLSDGAAVTKNWVSGERKGEAKTEEEIAAEKAEGVRERLENIANGTFTRRSSVEKLSPEERIRQSVVIGGIEAAARKSKTKLPNRTGKDADREWWQAKVASTYAANKAAVDKEVARQLKEMEKESFAVDLS